MRRTFVFMTLTGMLIGLGALLAGHPRPSMAATPEQPALDDASAPAELDPASDSAQASASPAAESSQAPGGEPGVEPGREPAKTMRKLRVVTLGWELLAPALLANEGAAPGPHSRFRSAGLEIELIAVDSIAELEARLARGGEVEAGADIAILPLPSFVAGYERTKALDPTMFFVAGFSSGRDLVTSGDHQVLLGASELEGSMVIVGEPGSAAVALSGFALVAHGVAPERIEIVAPEDEVPEDRVVVARERSLAQRGAPAFDPREIVLSSAAAPGLIPFVAIAPASFVNRHERELARFCEVWLSGVDLLAADVPAGARSIAAIPGAPESVDLIEHLAHLRFSTLDDNVRLAALAGRGALRLDQLFDRTWALWRALGVLSSAAPERAPLDSDVIARVALGGVAELHQTKPHVASLVRHPTLALAEPGQLGVRAGARLPEQLGEAELDAIVGELGFWAAVFDRPELELRVAGDRKLAQRVIDRAVDRFDLGADRLRAGKPLRGGGRSRIVVSTP